MKITIPFFSCEHAVNYIPPAYQYLFANQEEVLTTHRAFDIGALQVAKKVSKELSAECISANISRLLVDCNRRIKHKNFFSEFSKNLADSDKQRLINEYYSPYREKCENFINELINSDKQVLHLSIHSFTPVLEANIRNAAIGLLYDPKRHAEKEVIREWNKLLSLEIPHYRIRLNYPYAGISDGFTSSLRKKYKEDCYLGVEVEINQSLLQEEASLNDICKILVHSLRELLLLL